MLTRTDKRVVLGLYVLLALGLVLYLITGSTFVVYCAALPGVAYYIYHATAFYKRMFQEFRELYGAYGL